MDAKKIWVLEWCAYGDQRDTLHIDTLDRSLVANLKLFGWGRLRVGDSVWVVIAASEDEDYIREMGRSVASQLDKATRENVA